MSVVTGSSETGLVRPFDRHLALMMSAEILRKLAELSDEDQADYRELVEEYRKTDSDEDRAEILQAMVEIVLDEPAEGIPVAQIEREARRTLEGAAAADKFGRQARTFAANLKRLRRDRHLSQVQLAEASNMTQPQISYLERGEHRPQELTMKKLAEALAVPVEKLLPLE